MKLSIKKTFMFVLTLLALTFSALGVGPAYAAIDGTTFAAKVDFTAGARPEGIAISDMDGDGKPDIVVANYGSNNVSVFRNTSTSGTIAPASFAAKVDFVTGLGPSNLAVDDMDGDGKPDIVVGNYDGNSISVLRNTSTSGTVSFAARVDFTTGTNPLTIAIRDVDGDGKLDLATANSVSNTVSVYRNTSTSGTIDATSFAAKVDFTTGTTPYGVTIDDLDGDGKPDMAVANFDGNTVSVYRNTSTSGTIDATSFAAKVDFPSLKPEAVTIGDLDGDGKLDLVTPNEGGTVSVYRNTSTSGAITASSFAAKVDYTAGTYVYWVAIGDLDGDGKPDMTAANFGSNNISVFRNTSTSGTIDATSFAAKVDFTAGLNAYTVAIGDLDGDGKPDLAVSNDGSGSVSVFQNINVPTVVDLTSSTTDGKFMIGDTIDALVKFTSKVTVTGTPQLTFETGTTDRTVNYVSGSGTDTLLFNYTVQTGDTSADLNYVATDSLTLNGGTIKDASGNNAILTLPALNSAAAFAGSNNFVIDGILPLASINTKPANPSNSASATFTFSATDNLTVAPNFFFWCNLDTKGWEACDSGAKSYSGLAAGSHTFELDAYDEAGNVASRQSHTWTVTYPAATTLVNSVLPTSRTVSVGTMATIFNTVVNGGSTMATGVTLSINPAPAGTFVYQQTNCATNAIIGSPNPSLDVAAGQALCYVLSFTPSAAFAATSVHIRAQALNAPSTNLLTGINTWLLRSTAAVGPDIIALTTATDFHQVACSGSQAFAVALSNVGEAATGDITVTANTGAVTLPVSVLIQETNPTTGAVIGDNLLQNVGRGENRTVGVFVTFNGCINFDPAANRIFIEFKDASGNVVGSTSTAVSTGR